MDLDNRSPFHRASGAVSQGCIMRDEGWESAAVNRVNVDPRDCHCLVVDLVLWVMPSCADQIQGPLVDKLVPGIVFVQFDLPVAESEGIDNPIFK